jgi:glycosyltransferase involved in cell wall biosynthesis
LLERHRTVWVNTIGTRKPRLDFDTFRRGFEKFRHWTSLTKAATSLTPANLSVLNPRMWPAFDSRFARWLNRRLLSKAVSASIREFSSETVAITTIPLVADLIGVIPVKRWVYYCVDDFSTWPGLDGNTLRQMEEDLVKRVDVLIAVSTTLQDRIAEIGRRSHLLTHGVDVDFWAAPDPGVILGALSGLERPLIVFWGVIDRRMDTTFLTHLAAKLERGTIVLTGPDADPDPVLSQIPRLVRTGSIPFESLPALARDAAVLVMPYADLPVTRAMQPLKLKEYLATGKPVVVRDLPSTRPWTDCLDLASTAAEFAAAVQLRLRDGLPDSQQRSRSRLAPESWNAKAREFERWACEPSSSEE